jgi:hypothetical protein
VRMRLPDLDEEAEADDEPGPAVAVPDAPERRITSTRLRAPLNDDDRLVLAARFEEYLTWRHSGAAAPRSAREAAERIGWRPHTVAKRCENIRNRYVRIGVPGLRGPRALEELAALLISTGELTGDDLRRLPPRSAAGTPSSGTPSSGTPTGPLQSGALQSGPLPSGALQSGPLPSGALQSGPPPSGPPRATPRSVTPPGAAWPAGPPVGAPASVSPLPAPAPLTPPSAPPVSEHAESPGEPPTAPGPDRQPADSAPADPPTAEQPRTAGSPPPTAAASRPGS